MCTVEVGGWPTDRTDQARAIQSLLRDLGFFDGPTKGRSVRRRARRSASSSSPRARPNPASPARRYSSSSRGSAFRLRLERPSAGRGSVGARAGVVSAPRRWRRPQRTPKCHPLADATRIAIAYISAVVEEQPGGTWWTNIQSPTRWKRHVDFWRNAVNSPLITPPAMTLLLSSTAQNYAVAASGNGSVSLSAE